MSTLGRSLFATALVAASLCALAQDGGTLTPPPVPPAPAPSSGPVDIFVPSEKITADSSVSFPTDI